MTTIKSYSDLKQSKVLSKILSDDSADMSYHHFVSDLLPEEYCISVDKVECETDIPCWSLASLLSVLPHIQEFYPTLEKINNKYVCRYKESGIWTNGDNPVDACYEMIIKLHELKML
jgi:hypothetical protein